MSLESQPVARKDLPMRFTAQMVREKPADVLDIVSVGRTAEIVIEDCADILRTGRTTQTHIATIVPAARYEQLLAIEVQVKKLAASIG